MTVSGGQPTLSVDPEASLRAELTGAIAAAQIDIANAIAELARSGADSAALANQGHALQQLQRTVGSANLGSLLALRSDVTIAATSATALANQATSTAASAVANTNLSPSQRARANIEAVQRDLFEKRVLDPYLQFASAEDEEAYRKRERERDAEVKRALALRTPEGDRRATELVEDQLRDADAHGADRSPAFAAMLNQNAAAKDTLINAKPAAAPLASETKAPSSEVSDIAAALRAAGLTGDAPTVDESGHGLSFDKLASTTRTAEGRS
jgi:hypothetical protein